MKKDLEQQVMIAARDNGVSSVMFRNAIGRKLNLSVTDSECLSLLSVKGVSTPTELSRYTGLTSGSTTAMLDRLEKAGFIVRKPNPHDRRGVIVEITSKYGAAAGPLVMGLQKKHGDLIASYTNEQLETIADFLQRFTANVVSQTETIEKDL